jgi:hypothetical protein
MIRVNDLYRIEPDKRFADLSSGQRIRIMDKLLNPKDKKKSRGLEVVFNLSNAGRRINNRIYMPRGQAEGAVRGVGKPITKNHDTSDVDNIVGRLTDIQFRTLDQSAYSFFKSADEFMNLKRAFEADDVERIFNLMSYHQLLTNDSWQGLSELEAKSLITDEASIEKFLNGTYMDFSAGAHTDRWICSCCMQNWAKDGPCEHQPGRIYDGKMAIGLLGSYEIDEASIVFQGANSLSKVRSLAMSDSEGMDLPLPNGWQQFSDSSLYVTDSTSNVEVPAPEEQVLVQDKEYDHMLTINTPQMKELHEKGQVDIQQTDGDEKMIIRVVYRGETMTRDSEFEDKLVELMESVSPDFADEKKFKVPEGARGNARKVLEWKRKYGSEVKGMTPVGWARARQLANQSEIPLSTVKRMAAFNRHRKNAAIDPKFKSTPWKDRGYVAWLGWGGTTGVDWAIKISAANDEVEVEETVVSELEDAKRSSPKGKGAKTPADPDERIKGSKKNPKGSASKPNSKIAVGSVLETLKDKVKSHNEKYGKEKGKRVTLGMLKAVYRRGAGAFSQTHRPSMSRSGWGVARVNAFLKLVRSGRPSNPKYVQDNDLLPAGHPRKSSTKK